MTEPSTDWHQWHNAYDDPDSRLSERLRVVQAHVGAALDERAGQPRPIRITSMCAGQGRDVIGALAEHPRRHEVAALLVELDEGLAEAARASALAAGLAGVSVRCADASTSDNYAGVEPADIVLACGIFGNISDEDIHRTIDLVPMLCAPGATVIWTRYGRPGDDLAPEICRWFIERGFVEARFDASDERSYRVGSHRLIADPPPFEPGVRFFQFLR
jgi:hypothetical protein